MDDEQNSCATAKLARAVESPSWPPVSGVSSWACPTCARLAEVVLPYLIAIEARVSALERRGVLGTRGPGRVADAVCADCQRVFSRRSVLRKRCDACRVLWKRTLNRR